MIVLSTWLIALLGLLHIRLTSSVSCPENCLCPNQTNQISCDGAGLTEVPRSVGQSIAVIDLSNNQLVMISSASMTALRNIVRLRLSNNEIEKITDGAFEVTQALQTLDLSGNNLTEVSQYTFRGAAEVLLHLDLSRNRLSSVDGAFAGMRDLSRLDLRQNRLTSISQFTFRDLINLRYLLLADNHINYIDKRAFRALEKLMYLVLKGNPLGEVLRFQFNSLFLSYVDLSQCGLTRVPRGLPNSIRYLQLRRNNMTIIHRLAFTDCPYVSILVLDENAIAEVEDGAFEGMTYLQQLWLNYNRLQTLPMPLPLSLQRLLVESNSIREVHSNVFGAGSRLNTLSLAGNVMTEVRPEVLSRLTNLRLLDLSNNQLRRIYAQAFRANSQLRSLQLSRNPIEYLNSRCFHGLTGLRKLYLAYVPSHDVTIDDDVFVDIRNLTKMDLDNSPGVIRAILSSDAALLSLSNIQELSLQNSYLTSLRSDFPDFFPSLAIFYVSSTRWNCDKTLKWFRIWCTTTSVEVIRVEENRCFTPPNLQGRLLISLSDRDFASANPHLQGPTEVPLFTPRVGRFRLTPPGHAARGQRLDHANADRRMIGPTGNPGRLRPHFYDSDEGFVDVNKAFDGVDFDTAEERQWYDHEEIIEEKDRSSTAHVTLKIHPTTARHVAGTTKTTLPTPHVNLLTISRVYVKPHESRTRHPSPPSESNGRNAYIRTPATPSESNRNITVTDDANSLLFAVASAVTISVTVVIVIVIVMLIVGLTKEQSMKLQRKASCAGRMRKTSSGIIYSHRANVLYFVPRSSRGALPAAEGPVATETSPVPSDEMSKDASREAMSLIPGRDINHEGPLRVYMWTDF